MDLYKNTYIGNQYRKENEKIRLALPETEESTMLPIGNNIQTDRICEIKERVAYWRKANQIHKWFVENVQYGEDDCREYYVSKQNIQGLIIVCKEVLKEKGLAEKLLPCTSGLLFGNTSYNKYYYKELQSTIDMLEPLLLEEGGEFYYRSSW